MQETIASENTTQFYENEQELVVLAKKGDQYAFEKLYEFYFPKIYGYILKRVGNKEVAEDLVSAIFMKVFTKMEGYSPQGHTFGAWIYKIATNALIDYYRKTSNKKQVSIENAYDLSDKTESIQDYVDSSREIQVIKDVIKKMPHKYQEILHLRFFSELSNTEISITLELSPENARVRLHRAMKSFKKVYDKYAK